jgi:hypothetical protein
MAACIWSADDRVRVPSARFRIQQDRRDHCLQVTSHTGSIVAKNRGNPADVCRGRVAGDQVLNQILADEGRNVGVRENIV